MAGRPLKFESPEDMQLKIDAYFGDCDPHLAKRKIVKTKADGSTYIAEEDYITEQKPYTITGLALALDTNRQTIINYVERDAFFDTITRAKIRCEQFAEQHLFNGKTPAGAVFSLKNNYGWKDESTVNNRNTVVEDLDSLEQLDQGKIEMSEEAEKELNKVNESGPTPSEQVVEDDAPLQD